VQAAVNAAPENSNWRTIIQIEAGIYQWANQTQNLASSLLNVYYLNPSKPLLKSKPAFTSEVMDLRISPSTCSFVYHENPGQRLFKSKPAFMSELIELAILPSPCSLFSIQTQANDCSSQIKMIIYMWVVNQPRNLTFYLLIVYDKIPGQWLYKSKPALMSEFVLSANHMILFSLFFGNGWLYTRSFKFQSAALYVDSEASHSLLLPAHWFLVFYFYFTKKTPNMWGEPLSSSARNLRTGRAT
jgi:hypothetical protein